MLVHGEASSMVVAVVGTGRCGGGEEGGRRREEGGEEE